MRNLPVIFCSVWDWCPDWLTNLFQKLIDFGKKCFEWVASFFFSLLQRAFEGFAWLKRELTHKLLNAIKEYLPDLLDKLKISEIPVSKDKIDQFYTTANIWFPIDDIFVCFLILLAAWVSCWVWKHIIIPRIKWILNLGGLFKWVS